MAHYVVAVGRVRHAALREACEEYATRARRYFRLEIREIPDSGRRTRRPEDARRLEGVGLLRAIPADAVGVALTRAGRGEDSRRFAALLGRWQREAREVAWVVGGAYGLDPPVLARCAHRLSLSPWTLPHELARLVLLEQLYRAGTILKGEPYHKGPR
ncbi:MAG: 23S rRNA (pseudouridine(1915)-N(3))-methyltransferase RlmH [Gemmatimonadetes bacterium]|nr:23S rRNA (pseudouridine(1915)-N(3))-methyltransferase RlmH [Gemmatimonadota bacterium]